MQLKSRIRYKVNSVNRNVDEKAIENQLVCDSEIGQGNDVAP